LNFRIEKWKKGERVEKIILINLIFKIFENIRYAIY